MKKAIFLDRDGVINKLIVRNGKKQAPYHIDEFELLEGVTEAVLEFKKAGFLTVVVTNQPDVKRGWVEKESVELMNQLVQNKLEIDHIEVCYHDNLDNCFCRKPNPGMLLSASQKLEISTSDSFMIGDRYGDVLAGKLAGCKTFLVGEGDNQGDLPTPDYKVSSLLEAAKIILMK